MLEWDNAGFFFILFGMIDALFAMKSNWRLLIIKHTKKKLCKMFELWSVTKLLFQSIKFDFQIVLVCKE